MPCGGRAFARWLSVFLEWEAGRRHGIRKTLTEVRGGMELEAINIRLTGVADRIDVTGPNAADIIDYKTGYNPSLKHRHACFSIRSLRSKRPP